MILLSVSLFLSSTFIIVNSIPARGFKGENHIVQRRAISDWCTISDDKSTVDCTNVKFIGQTAGIIMKVNKCDEPVTITFSILIKALDIKWSKVLESDQEFAIPGFEYSIAGLKAGVYVRTNVYKDEDDKNLKLKLKLRVELSAGSVPAPLPVITVFDGTIPVEAKCNEQWSNMQTGEKVGIVVGACIGLIVIIIVILALIYRYGKSRKTYGATRKVQFKLPRIFKTKASTPYKQTNKKNAEPKNKNLKASGTSQNGVVLNNVRGYENKQYESDKTNIKKAGKSGPQKFQPQRLQNQF